jgi:hypothetical protein
MHNSSIYTFFTKSPILDSAFLAYFLSPSHHYEEACRSDQGNKGTQDVSVLHSHAFDPGRDPTERGQLEGQSPGLLHLPV